MASRPTTSQTYTCATCEIEIAGPATLHDGLAFCCAGCAAGGPCICSYDDEAMAGSRIRHCLDIRAFLEDDEEGRVAAATGAARR